MKKTAAMLLALIMLVMSSAAPVGAYAEDSFAASAVTDNPYYSGREIKDAAPDTDSASKSISNDVYYPKGESLYTIVKSLLKSRSSSFTLHYFSFDRLKTKTAVINLMDALLSGATDEAIATGSEEGDYLRWSVKTFGAKTTTLDKSEGGKYYYTFEMQVSYYTTAEQEKALNAQLVSFKKTLNASNLSDYKKVLKIHDYICSKAKYEYNAVSTPSKYPEAFSAYGALVKGKAVCQGYAAAFYRLCREVGLGVRTVTSDVNRGAHAWNIIELDTKYYFIDCTWDDINIDENSGEARQYFLLNYESVCAFDSEKQEHTLDSKYYDTAEFNKNYRNSFSDDNYDITDMYLFSRCVINVKYKKGKPIATVRRESLAPLDEGRDYAVKLKYAGSGKFYAVVEGRGRYKNAVKTFKAVRLNSLFRHKVK